MKRRRMAPRALTIDGVVKLQERDNRPLFTREYDKPYECVHSFGRTCGEHREFLEFGRGELLPVQRRIHRLVTRWVGPARRH